MRMNVLFFKVTCQMHHDCDNIRTRAKGERAWKRQSLLKTIRDAEGGLGSTPSSSKNM